MQLCICQQKTSNLLMSIQIFLSSLDNLALPSLFDCEKVRALCLHGSCGSLCINSNVSCQISVLQVVVSCSSSSISSQSQSPSHSTYTGEFGF